MHNEEYEKYLVELFEAIQIIEGLIDVYSGNLIKGEDVKLKMQKKYCL